MTKTKQNLAKYNEARAEWREKLQTLFDEKDKKRAAIKELFGDNPEEMKKQSKAMRTKLNAKWKEENKDLITKYQELYQQKKLDEETFQKWLEEFRKLDPEIDEEVLRDLIMGKTEKKESKETMEKPQLESENYKIDKWLTKKEKLDQWWKEEERLAYINGIETNIKVLKKELTEGAFVREYQDDGKIPKHLVGEQLFNKVAVTYLDLWKKLPTRENMVVMRWKTKEERENFLKNNFQKDWKNLFPGFWDPDDKGFYGIGKRTGYWLSDGSIVGINKDNMHHYNGNPEFGFSLRFLKN